MTSALVSRAPLCIALAVAPAAVAAAAQYPVRPVRFIVPAAPGATNDLLARVMGQKLSEQLGQQFVVDNRPGAAGAIGTDILAKSPPDGHTIGMIFTSHTTNAVLRKLPYDPVRDIAPVTMLTSAPLVLVIHPALGVNSVRELVALAKTKPLTYGSAGVGSGNHLAAEQFKSMAGIDATHVAYKGAAPAIADVAANNISFQFTAQLTVQALIKAGRLKPLAVTSAKRAASLPDVPTVAESGVPGYEMLNWFGVASPAGAPGPVITRLHAELMRALKLPDVREKLINEGSEIIGSAPAAFAEFIKQDIARWTKVVKAAGIKAE